MPIKMDDSSTLIIKHFPSELNLGDREEFLKLFGAKYVTCLPDDGKMRYTAFATFDSNNDAKFALSRLHQLEILNRKLVVEFVRKEHKIEFSPKTDGIILKPSQKTEQSQLYKIPEKEKLKTEAEKFCKNLHGTCPSLNLDYIPSPLLKYKYPSPTPVIIANISHTLASVPKFYTQVLHLMNKMNLPAPFGPLTPAPPYILEYDHSSTSFYNPPGHDVNEIKEMNSSSEEESEMESDSENLDIHKVDLILPVKRKTTKIQKHRKKPKLRQIVLAMQPPISSKTEPSDVFETQPQLDTQKKIQFNIKPTLKPDDISDSVISTSDQEQSGFGFIVATKTDSKTDEKNESDDDNLNISEFISMHELRKKRVSSREMKTLSIFRNYDPGEPTVRLYIKNLAKQVDEKDLRYIFGKFIDPNSETDKNMFDIRLMKEGRMKGQAFVTLANEKQAIEAVKETNGFVLHTKPLVVQFARSAKPKDTPNKGVEKK